MMYSASADWETVCGCYEPNISRFNKNQEMRIFFRENLAKSYPAPSPQTHNPGILDRPLHAKAKRKWFFFVVDVSMEDNAD